MRKAFTMAEVLVTLGIIGIVAAMTLPTLLARHRSKVLEAQFWKRYNEVSQTLLMIKRDEMPLYGNYSGPKIQPLLAAQFKGAKGGHPAWGNTEQQKRVFGFELPNYKTIDKSQTYNTRSMDDGSVIVSKEFFIFFNSDYNDSTNVQFLIDVNGLQNPNIVGYDVFVFRLEKDDVLKPAIYNNKYEAARLCNPKSSVAGNSNGCYCSYFAMTDKNYFKNLNW